MAKENYGSLSIYYITKSNTKAESVNKGWSLKKKR